jgi:SAM-dependent methyltransferase
MMKRLLIWGTGTRAEKALISFPHQRYDIIAFIDNSSERHGKFHGKPVISAEAALEISHDHVLIASSSHVEISEQAIALGFDKSRILPAGYIDFLQYAEKVDTQQLELLSKVPWWYHTFEILPGVITPGICGYRPEFLAHPLLQDLEGKRALDIGAWDGPYTLEMSRRGASVMAFDIQPPSHTGFDTMRLINNLKVQHTCESVYNLSPSVHGTFDLVTFFGVYYHLRNPLAAFAAINTVLPMGGLMVVEGAVLEGAPLIDDYWKERTDQVQRIIDLPIAAFAKDEYQGEWSNWWVPTLTCLKHWIESCGFSILEHELIHSGTRGLSIARKVGKLQPEHAVLGSAS